MKQTRLIMGMTIVVVVADKNVLKVDLGQIFNFFMAVDRRYSTFKPDSEISQINAGLPRRRWSLGMKQILNLCEQTKQQTNGFFDIKKDGRIDPSGLVKGWAINKAAELLSDQGYNNFYINAGGDIQVSGCNNEGMPWRVGVRNPFNGSEQVKVISLNSHGVATSGTYERGQHIYNPKTGQAVNDLASITVVGPDIYEADRFATAAYAMGAEGLRFIENLDGLEAYAITHDKQAAMTSGFRKYVVA